MNEVSQLARPWNWLGHLQEPFRTAHREYVADLRRLGLLEPEPEEEAEDED